MKSFISISRWIHKYIGLLLIVFLVWMSISGVFLNHPSLIASIEVPVFLTPEQYRFKNWNRSLLTELHFLENEPRTAIGCGKAGVWISYDSGLYFEQFNDGLPEGPYYRKTADLYVWEGSETIFFAGTKGGLFQRASGSDSWTKVELPQADAEIKKILHVKDRLLVFSDSDVFAADFPAKNLNFRKTQLERDRPLEKVSLVDLFFELHSGALWGLPGKLLYDAAGVILFFLSLSAFYSWYYPWKRKREKPFGIQSSGRVRRMFKWFLKYHLKLGIWAAFILFIFGATGLFMRPPMLVALTGDGISKTWYPGILDKNPWHGKINNALYDVGSDEIIIEAKDGFWKGKADFGSSFKKTDLNMPVFVMGTTVFESIDGSSYLAGSFNGIFRYDKKSDSSFDLVKGRKAHEVSSVKPADLMITGFFRTPAGESFITTHEQGLLPLNGTTLAGRFEQPLSAQEIGLPLWNWFFEIHNGRFFKDWIGGLYILIIPLGSILYILTILSGVVDWLYYKVWKKYHPKRKTVLIRKNGNRKGKNKTEIVR